MFLINKYWIENCSYFILKSLFSDIFRFHLMTSATSMTIIFCNPKYISLNKNKKIFIKPISLSPLYFECKMNMHCEKKILKSPFKYSIPAWRWWFEWKHQLRHKLVQYKTYIDNEYEFSYKYRTSEVFLDNRSIQNAHVLRFVW